MKRILYAVLFLSTVAVAQKKADKKADKLVIDNLKAHVDYLADDRLEGRRTGSAGEKLAYEYITEQFTGIGLAPKGENGGYLQTFEVKDGKMITDKTMLSINGSRLGNRQFFPLSYSGNGALEASPAIALSEAGSPWFWDLKEILEEHKDNPHFDLDDAILKKAAAIAGKGATGLFIYNSSTIKDELQFDEKSKTAMATIPVIYLNYTAKERYLKDEMATADIRLNVEIAGKSRWGHNVVGYLDNGAATTIILGAHYDHLGYGEDNNSLYAGKVPQIHNGADDNASGTAAMIELAKLLQHSGSKKNNYLFIAFSGEELGLFGSKYFTEHPAIDISTVNYMMNMDMVGRLNDSTHGLNVGGYGTSPVWGQLLSEKNAYFKIKFDSSGSGPSDHTSFYRKDIPVLFFFTGAHADYHKPSDDADKINYTGELQVIRYINSIIDSTDAKGKLAFSKTRESATAGRTSFKVTLGIMPDYTYTGTGVRVDGVSDGKAAQRIGIKTGDVIIQLGEHKFSDVQTYMQALGKFNKGDSTRVKVKRGNEELSFDLVF